MISGIGDFQYPPCLSNPCSQSSGPKKAAAQVQLQSSDHIHISRQARQQQTTQAENVTGPSDEKDLTAEDQQEVEKLKNRDQEVKAHERAHVSAGADVVIGGANYEYQRGPDGKMYAVGGEVKIDTSKEKDPQATVRKMQKIKRAALAPAQPSATDRTVAAKASQLEAEARIESTKEKEEAQKEEQENKNGTKSSQLPTIDLKGYAGTPLNNPNIHVMA